MIEYFGGDIQYDDKTRKGYIKLENLIPKESYEVVGDFSLASFMIAAALIEKNQIC